MFDVGVLEQEIVSSECRLERLRLEEDEVVEERLTIMVRISSLRELMDVSKLSLVHCSDCHRSVATLSMRSPKASCS